MVLDMLVPIVVSEAFRSANTSVLMEPHCNDVVKPKHAAWTIRLMVDMPGTAVAKRAT